MQVSDGTPALPDFYDDGLLEQAASSFSEKIKHFFFVRQQQCVACRNDFYFVDGLKIFFNGFIIPEMPEAKHDINFIVIPLRAWLKNINSQAILLNKFPVNSRPA